MNIFVFDLDNTLLTQLNYQKLSRHIKKYGFNNIEQFYRNNVPVNNYIIEQLKKIRGPKFLFTNAEKIHALISLKTLGILKQFSGIYSYSEIGLYKPHPTSYYKVQYWISQYIKTNRFKIFFFDDLKENLIGSKRFNWTTVYINSKYNKNNVEYNADYNFKNINKALDFFIKYQQ